MSIKKSLIPLDFPENIKVTATEIISMVCKITKVYPRKGSNDNYINYFGIYHAYNKLRKIQNLLEIAEKIGMTKGEITKALNKYSEVRTGIKMELIRFTHGEYIEYCCVTLSIKDKKLISEITEGIIIFDEENPKFKINRNSLAYAIGYIRYYILVNFARAIKTKILREKFLLCETVINSYFNMIGSMHKK